MSQMCHQHNDIKNYAVQSLDLRTSRKVTDAVLTASAAA